MLEARARASQASTVSASTRTSRRNASPIATAIGEALKRNVRAEAETVEAWEARALASGMGEHERTTLAAMFRYYAEHGLVGNPSTLSWLLGRAPNSLARCLGRVAVQPEA